MKNYFLTQPSPELPYFILYTISTQSQLYSIHSFLQENLKEAEEKHLQADEKFLSLLGLTGKVDEWHNTSVPAIVSYAFDGQYAQAISLSRNIASKLPNHTLIIYDLGLSKYSLNKVILLLMFSTWQDDVFSIIVEQIVDSDVLQQFEMYGSEFRS